MKFPPANITSYIRHIRCLLNEYPNHTLCLSGGSKSKYKSAYAYSIGGSLISHRIRNVVSVFTAELMAIFSFLVADFHTSLTLSLLFSTFSTNTLTQRIHSTLHSLHSIGSQITFIWIPGYIGFPKHDAVDKAAKQVSSFPRKKTIFVAFPSLISKIVTAHSSSNHGIHFGKPNSLINSSS